ncbi:putative F420-dependent oxidoreductase, Rv2161c family [Mycobacterium sp. JS623]|uniref:TIGR03619 family F420-dependent LLM class oxidoreductase n=1 Tax=Mycobacterium sp. JS623 TaxID=212767 RepID=UPI0002A577A1|nr:TIGR03619 family F420-dependent LLM class oxidoreductase [Mycobacterium sp. JS623]AGB24405.1 putative F420-dependent oxidoreductase, Rv2161c family [Mycobacterium sp. JS623]
MRIGLSTPIVVQVPGVASRWESTATIHDLARIARVADDLGYDHLSCSEHVAIPRVDADIRGAVYWDPLATFGFLAAHSQRIKLATAVLVLGYHHPLEIAKRYGTLDSVSGGRLILGLGIGSLRQEFELLNAPWEARAARADDAIAAIRASMSTSTPRYRGRFYQYEDVIVEPCAQQDRVPIWVGGRSAASLRRAVRLADGWMPFGLTNDQIARMTADIELPTDFELVLAAPKAVDPDGNPANVRSALQALRDAGATTVTCSVRAESADHYCEQLERLMDIAADIEENI